jgi:hypothetical protein
VTVAVDDPLIAAMDIRRPLPLHESSCRLRELCPHSPRDHGVAVLADVSRRRWWPLESAITTDRLQVMFEATAAGMEKRAAIVDPTLRVLPDDTCFRHDDAPRQAAVVPLPSELALTTWVAHRCHRTLVPLFSRLRAVSDETISEAAMWQIVGSAIVAVATRMPHLAATDELTGMRRSQAILDAMVGFGLPVRGPSRHASTKGNSGLAKLGQPCLR